jgi:copper transporter 1
MVVNCDCSVTDCWGVFRMLAVMTLNVGYFLSILAGVFVGELLVGRYNNSAEEHH